MEFLELIFSRHGTCKLLCDTSLALARSSPTRRYTGNIWCHENASAYLLDRSECRIPNFQFLINYAIGRIISSDTIIKFALRSRSPLDLTITLGVNFSSQRIFDENTENTLML